MQDLDGFKERAMANGWIHKDTVIMRYTLPPRGSNSNRLDGLAEELTLYRTVEVTLFLKNSRFQIHPICLLCLTTKVSKAGLAEKMV